MKREVMIDRIKKTPDGWDVIVIGGGATGLGTAVDAATRGLKTLLVEAGDFACGTSSRSTKLVHGGLRYLQQGHIHLVYEALHERRLLLSNAPHLVHKRDFFVPAYKWWELPFYGLGVKLYDLLSFGSRLNPSHFISRKNALQLMPTVNPQSLKGGIIYTDGQFNDARLAITLAQTLSNLSGVCINYMPVQNFIKENDQITGIEVHDTINDKRYSLRGKHIINCTGTFTDQIRQLDDPNCTPIMRLSQGIHLTLPRAFLPSDTALLVPKTADGRVLFIIPWHDHTLIGTTETPLDQPTIDPKPFDQEIEFILSGVAPYLTSPPTKNDILATFAGVRPLVSASSKETGKLARTHRILKAPSGLITLTGGKWTTYRKMAQDVIDTITKIPCTTQTLKLHGYAPYKPCDHLGIYGSDREHVKALIASHPDYAQPLHPDHPYLLGEAIWAMRHEMAQNTEDILQRRLPLALLDESATTSARALIESKTP